MSARTERQIAQGLELAKDCLRRIVAGKDIAELSAKQDRDLLAAITWISHKQAVDERRRQPRGNYRRQR